jgi:hypothetical protein
VQDLLLAPGADEPARERGGVFGALEDATQ